MRKPDANMGFALCGMTEIPAGRRESVFKTAQQQSMQPLAAN
jgi:hypothetical protein